MVQIYFGLAVVAAIWGANFGVARWAMGSFDPELFAFLRFSLALPLFFVVLKMKEGSIGVADKQKTLGLLKVIWM